MSCGQTYPDNNVLFHSLSFLQHFREHLDKLFAQGIGMLDIALTEAFTLLGDVSPPHVHTHTVYA